MSNVINRAKLNDKLSFMCYRIAQLTTYFLMNSKYNNPSQEFCRRLSVTMALPFLISPWDSATEIKNKVDRAFKTTGLASAYNIKAKCRYSSIPTKKVLHHYATTFLTSYRPAIAQESFNNYWQAMRNNLITYFNNELSKDEPEYYRSLRDERGDKTPTYIKRKLWLQACKQALKGIAKANTEQAAADMSARPK